MCLGLTYLLASTAGAAGVGGCVHADLEGGAHGHAAHAPAADVGSESHPHGYPIPLPCAADPEADATESASSSHHSPAQPCDCLGDCSVSAEALEIPSTRVPHAASPGAVPEVATRGVEVRARALQYRLPYPNAPPAPRWFS